MTEKQLLKFKKPNVVPPGGYKYLDPDTDHVTIAASFMQLVNMAASHRVENQLDVPENFRAVVEDWICHQIPADMTTGDELTYPKYMRPTTSSTVQASTRIILYAWRDNGRKVVSVTESNKRAAICLKCENNTPSTACFSCKGLLSWVRGWTGRTTPFDQKLFVCRIGAMLNISHIHVHDSILKKVSAPDFLEAHPLNCWKRKLLEK